MQNRVGAVVIGTDFQALGVVRSLSEEGVPVFIIECERGICTYSRYATRTARNHLLLSNGSFPGYLADIARKEGLEGWVLFPNSDECVKLLSLNRDFLKTWYRNPVPEWEVVKKFYYKESACEIARKAGIPIPRLYKGENLESFMQQDLRFPLVLKPACKELFYPKTKKKAIRIDSREDFAREYARMCDIIPPPQIVVQDMIEGGPRNLYSFAGVFDGQEIVAGMSALRRRQHPMDFGHATTYGESVNIPELEMLSQKLLREIGYFGIAEVEFMKDERDGRFKFIEINGRPWGWHTLAKAAGVNVPFILFQLMLGKEVERPQAIEGIKWVRLLTDIPTVTKELLAKRMGLGAYLHSLKGKKEFAVLSRKDPLPFLFEIIMIPYLWRKRGF